MALQCGNCIPRWAGFSRPCLETIPIGVQACLRQDRRYACRGMYTVLPEPGGPSISRLCAPAAAMISARLAISWPRTSA